MALARYFSYLASCTTTEQYARMMICGREVVVQFLSATLCRAPQKLRLTVKLATTCLLLAARLEERISKWTDGKVTGDATAAGGWLILILEHGRQTRFGRAHVAGRLTVAEGSRRPPGEASTAPSSVHHTSRESCGGWILVTQDSLVAQRWGIEELFLNTITRTTRKKDTIKNSNVMASCYRDALQLHAAALPMQL
ncbi:hypothetical protein CTAM01_08779 [Colletotrichum tamarilloi]|uniref:Uncharacterized protein n=1 Tax=Colletotrichum tamarilloi TaxID=1209934 RepID=A0ABQ9R514_9PEZI|nr:uncharacterized protein CTAM01_08779 [Colletotrichum tamarilloi]KAK1494766.1 hypothetical protein CTAM01_08779 [Colletotrichum tamarilloi]